MNEPKPESDQLQMGEEQQKELEDRYRGMIEELVYDQGMSPRKAKRYLESEAKRNTRKLIREGKRRQEKLRKAGKLVDTSDIAAKLDLELKEQLAALPPLNSEEKEYKSPTSEF